MRSLRRLSSELYQPHPNLESYWLLFTVAGYRGTRLTSACLVTSALIIFFDMIRLQDESGFVHSIGRILEDISIADFIPHYPTKLPKRFQPTPSGDVIVQFTILSSKTKNAFALEVCSADR